MVNDYNSTSCLICHPLMKSFPPLESGWVIKGNCIPILCTTVLMPWATALEVHLPEGHGVVKKSSHMEKACVGAVGSESPYLSPLTSGSRHVNKWAFKAFWSPPIALSLDLEKVWNIMGVETTHPYCSVSEILTHRVWDPSEHNQIVATNY